MAYKSLFNGITFIEGPEYSCKVLCTVEYKKTAFIITN